MRCKRFGVFDLADAVPDVVRDRLAMVSELATCASGSNRRIAAANRWIWKPEPARSVCGPTRSTAAKPALIPRGGALSALSAGETGASGTPAAAGSLRHAAVRPGVQVQGLTFWTLSGETEENRQAPGADQQLTEEYLPAVTPGLTARKQKRGISIGH